MNLLLPLALYGFLAVPLILLLHLLRNRRKKMSISSLRLWRDLHQRRHGSLPRSIPLSFMLLLQLCAAIGLTLALARPAFSFLLDQPEQTIFILDTTTSMAATDVSQVDASGQAVQRFDVARQSIIDSIRTMDGNDRVAVIGLGPAPTLILSANAAEVEPAVKIVDSLRPGGNQVDLTSALALANELVDPEKANRIVVLSDGNYELDPGTLPPVLAALDWQLIPAQSSDSENQALLDVSGSSLPDER